MWDNYLRQLLPEVFQPIPEGMLQRAWLYGGMRDFPSDKGLLRRQSKITLLGIACDYLYSYLRCSLGWDGTSLGDRLREFAHQYDREVGLPFGCLASPLSITEEKLALLRRVALKGLQIGIQSGSERTRRLYQREGSAEAVIRAGQILARFIPPLEPPKYDIILDNPYETLEDLQDTIHLLMRIPPPYRVQPFSLVFIPGTDLHTRAVTDGLIRDEPRQIYRKQFHVAGNIQFKLLLSLTGSRFPQPLLRLLAGPQLLKLFNQPAMLRFLERLRHLKVRLSVRRRTALLTARLPVSGGSDPQAH